MNQNLMDFKFGILASNLCSLFMVAVIVSGCSKPDVIKSNMRETSQVAMTQDLHTKGFSRKPTVSVLDANRIIDCYNDLMNSVDLVEEFGGPLTDSVMVMENEGGDSIVAFEFRYALDLRIGYLYHKNEMVKAVKKGLFSVN